MHVPNLVKPRFSGCHESHHLGLETWSLALQQLSLDYIPVTLIVIPLSEYVSCITLNNYVFWTQKGPKALQQLLLLLLPFSKNA